MMKYLSLVAIIASLILQSCGETATKPSSTNGTAAKETNAETIDLAGYEVTAVAGTELKLLEVKSENGDATISGFVDEQGRKQGSWTTWKDSRSPTIIANYLDGQLHGAYTEMDPVGRVKKMAHYLNGELHGRYAEYRASIPQITSNYKHGELDGVYRQHTLQTGKVNRSITYKNGQPDGPMKWFNDNEELIQERLYRNGELVD